MNMYVWKDVFCDYTCGMVVVVAHDIEEARSIIIRDLDGMAIGWFGENIKRDPEVYDYPAAVYVFGGG